MDNDIIKRIFENKTKKPIMLSQLVALWSNWPDAPVGEDMPLKPHLEFVILPRGKPILKKITFTPIENMSLKITGNVTL